MLASTLCTSNSNWPLNFQSPCLGLCSATYTSVPSWSGMLPMKCSPTFSVLFALFRIHHHLGLQLFFLLLALSTQHAIFMPLLHFESSGEWVLGSSYSSNGIVCFAHCSVPSTWTMSGMSRNEGQGAFTPLSAVLVASSPTFAAPPQIILASPTFDSWTYHGLQSVLSYMTLPSELQSLLPLLQIFSKPQITCPDLTLVP